MGRSIYLRHGCIFVRGWERMGLPRARTGATNGRVAGRLSAGLRARKALTKAPRVKVVRVLGGKTPEPAPAPAAAAPVPTVEPLLVAQLNAAAGAADTMATMLGLTPTKVAAAKQVALAAVSACIAAGSSHGPEPVLSETPAPSVSAEAAGKQAAPSSQPQTPPFTPPPPPFGRRFDG